MSNNKKETKQATPKKRGRPPKIVEEKPKRKRGRPRKVSISAPIVEKLVETPPNGLCDQWSQGQLKKFETGDVVETKNGKKVGVIGRFIPDQYKNYRIKWHTGTPNAWDFIWSEIHEDSIRKSDVPNPIDIPSWKKYPGPSSKMIEQLQTSFAKQRNEKKDVNAIIESLEEERKRKRSVSRWEKALEDDDEEEVDSVVDKTLEEECIDDGRDKSDEMYEILKRELEDE